MTAYLRRQGLQVAHCTVDRLMRDLAMNGVRRGKTLRTTIPGRDGNRGSLRGRGVALGGSVLPDQPTRTPFADVEDSTQVNNGRASAGRAHNSPWRPRGACLCPARHQQADA